MAFPKIISSMGDAGTIIGVLFFASLFIAGLTSMASVIQVPISAFEDKFGWSHKKAVSIIGGFSALISVALFSTKTAITFVDIIDHFANNIGVVFGAILSIIWVTWLHRGLLDKLIAHINGISSFKVGAGWSFVLTVVTPISLIVALVLSLKSLLSEGYGGYDFITQLVFGWGVVAVFAIGAMILTKVQGHVLHNEQKRDYHE